MLTEDMLKNVLRDVMSQRGNLCDLLMMDETMTMSDTESIEWAVNRLYSEKLLDFLNHNMAYAPVVNMKIFDIDTAPLVIAYDCGLPFDVQGGPSVPLVWPKKIICLGRWGYERCGTEGNLWVSSGPACYLDENGALVHIKEYRTAVDLKYRGIDTMPVVRYLRLVMPGESKLYSLSEMDEFFPAPFAGFWDV